MTALGGAAVAYMVKFTLDRASIHAHAGSCCIMLDHAGICCTLIQCAYKSLELCQEQSWKEGTSPPLLE